MIQVQQLQKAYEGRKVLCGVNLQVEAGDRIALVGPNGSGKTTLMRAIMGLVRGEGRIQIGGHDPWEDHAAAMRDVAYVPQRAPALPAPVGELVEAWGSLRRRPSDQLVEEARIFGLDLAAIRTVPFRSLSGGMQQKLLISMALASPASLLVFDEPTASLDPAARTVFLSRLAGRSPFPTVLLSSHRMEEIRDLVERVVVLEEGRLRFDGRLSAFLERSDLTEAAGLQGSPVLPFRRP